MRQNTPFTPWLDWLDDQFEQMLAHSIRLARIHSASLDAAGVNRVGEQVLRFCDVLGGTSEVLALSPCVIADPQGNKQPVELGNLIRIRKRPAAPCQILLCAQLDTAGPADHPVQTTTRLEAPGLDDEILRGPGVANLKGGILVMIKALQALERSPWADRIGWEILLTPDEELGSPASAARIADAAKSKRLALGFKPCCPALPLRQRNNLILGPFGHPAQPRLEQLRQDAARSLGLLPPALPAAGLRARSLPCPLLDQLGVVGGNIGQADEYLQVISLVERAKLCALLLMTLASAEDLSWLEEEHVDYPTAQLC